MMPPSPWLSARMIRMAYLSETIRISDQRISDTMPMMRLAATVRSAGVGGLLEGIKRAGADIAVDDAERGEGGTRECWRTRVAGSRDWMRMLGHVSALPAMGSVTENAGEANQERGPDQRLVGTDRVCLALRFGGTSGF